MGKINPVDPVKLISGCIFKDEAVYQKTIILLEKKFGKIDFESPILKFDYTDYYENEFGKCLSRKFVSFKKLILPDRLADIKTFTNKLELDLTSNNRRIINIDPGYLDLAKLVLATTKDFAHRIYLKHGIFAEVTLFYNGAPRTKARGSSCPAPLGRNPDFIRSLRPEVFERRDKSSFTFRDWTYPDYRTPEYIEIFNHIREIYAIQKKLLPSG